MSRLPGERAVVRMRAHEEVLTSASAPRKARPHPARPSGREMRDDLAFALTYLRLGQPQSLWRTAEARTAAIIQYQRLSEKKKTEMEPQDLRVLRLYKVQLAYG
jgi:hypothetical protein